MSPLHLSKVAVGCAGLEALRLRQDGRAEGDRVAIRTRYRPKEADRLIGGSLFWIIRHGFVARQVIHGFAEDEMEKKVIVWLDRRLVPVEGWPKRGHQGWRYLQAADAPPDLGAESGLMRLPPQLARTLADLALI